MIQETSIMLSLSALDMSRPQAVSRLIDIPLSEVVQEAVQRHLKRIERLERKKPSFMKTSQRVS